MLIELTLADEVGKVYVNPAHICSLIQDEGLWVVCLVNNIVHKIVENPQEIYRAWTTMAGHANLKSRFAST